MGYMIDVVSFAMQSHDQNSTLSLDTNLGENSTFIILPVHLNHDNNGTKSRFEAYNWEIC